MAGKLALERKERGLDLSLPEAMALLILPQGPASTAIALVVALTPLALLGARSPGFRVAHRSAR